MSLTELRKEYQTLQQRINALNEEMKEKSKILMKQEFSDFFEKYGDIVSKIFWTQYTPYFNDGESCEFSVHEIYLSFIGDDENDDDDEGSTVYTEEDVVDLKNRILEWERFNADPVATVQKHRSKYIANYNRDPFEAPWRGRKSVDERIAEWTPDYISLSALQDRLVLAENVVAKYPALKTDFNAIRLVIGGIEDSLMESMFGNHVKVIVTANGIETEEYQHN
jgi:hypothetical protein